MLKTVLLVYALGLDALLVVEKTYIFGESQVVKRRSCGVDYNFFVEMFIEAFHARVKSFFCEGVSSEPVEAKVAPGLLDVKYECLHASLSLFLTNYIM